MKTLKLLSFYLLYCFSYPAYSTEYITITSKIDVPSNNDCPTRKGHFQILLPPGYSYYDYEYLEENAMPKPADVTITPNPTKTGVNVDWKVPHIGTYIGSWCGGAHSWLKANINVRGFKN